MIMQSGTQPLNYLNGYGSAEEDSEAEANEDDKYGFNDELNEADFDSMLSQMPDHIAKHFTQPVNATQLQMSQSDDHLAKNGEVTLLRQRLQEMDTQMAALQRTLAEEKAQAQLQLQQKEKEHERVFQQLQAELEFAQLDNTAAVMNTATVSVTATQASPHARSAPADTPQQLASPFRNDGSSPTPSMFSAPLHSVTAMSGATSPDTACPFSAGIPSMQQTVWRHFRSFKHA